MQEANEQLSREMEVRRQTEEELRHAEEVANAVIHNIGNVVNSVKVSAMTMRETLQDSKLPSLLRANDLMESHWDHVGDWLRDDPRGKNGA